VRSQIGASRKSRYTSAGNVAMKTHPVASAVVLLVILGGWAWSQAPAESSEGSHLYTQHCAACHDAGIDRAPKLESLREMTPQAVLAALDSGAMVQMATGLSGAQRRMVSEFVAGKTFAATRDVVASTQGMCSGAPAAFTDPQKAPMWNGWGVNTSNTRFQRRAEAGITAADVPKLKLKWAIAFPRDISRNAAPTVFGGRVFTGSGRGTVYSINMSSGCIEWTFSAGAGVRTAPTVASIDTASGPRYAVFFGDSRASAYALEAETGKLIWKTKVEDMAGAGITGSPVFYMGRLYVPVRGGDEVSAVQPSYECCRFRGSLVALDASTGKQIWKSYTITEEPHKTKTNAAGAQLWGPSGAPIWTTPAIDPKLSAIYVTTGDNYSKPTTNTSDAFVAFDLKTGKILWTRQMTANDSWTSACRLPDKTNCPDVTAPDFDFGASPMLVTLSNGHRLLLAGQKSGMVHALDPDQQGEVVWQVRVGKGGTLGGVQWGSAADRENVYVAVSDMGRIMLDPALHGGNVFGAWEADPKVGGGLFALRLKNGKRVWYAPPAGCGDKKPCSPAQSAAVTAIPGVVFSGSVDGHMRAYSMSDGKVLWDFDTIRKFETVNGVEGRGGSLNGPGPVIAGGMVFFNSGYAAGGTSGNVLLAFSVEGK
jgi:polyvinyl alcohol dehydrogenase (cytochrome)